MTRLALLVVGAMALASTGRGPASAEEEPSPDSRVETSTALEVLGVQDGDQLLSFDTVPRDAYRLPLVDALLRDPRDLPALAGDVGGAGTSILEAPSSLLLQSLTWLFGTRVPVSPIGVEAQSLYRELGRAPEAEARFVRTLTAGAVASSRMLAPARASLTPETLASVVDLLREDPSDATRDPFELREAERGALVESDRVYDALAGVDRAALVRAGMPLANALREALRALGEASVEDWVPLAFETTAGRVIVGSREGETHEEVGALVFVDIGGDDRYVRGAGGTRASAGGVSLVVDLAGNDVYESQEEGTLAAGLGGVGVLLDRAGDDVYRGRDAAMGVGVLGVGMLVDLAGHDVYDGQLLGEGAGFLGVGLLLDGAGNDTYRLGLYGQGFGGVGGVGVVRDFAGGDRYLGSPLFVDVIRYEEHFNSFLQGASLGSRPDRSGGIGLLVDDNGNDLYECDVFGQGSAYWFGIGALVDKRGHDVYAGYQYAQGAGIHYGLGLLADAAGEDTYRARGVSQGCGHDRGAGALVDDGGNDAYVSYDLSQGAGSANGFGILVDRSGRDAYVVRRPETALGYGNPRNGSGSLGLLLDLRGDDAYAAGGRDSTIWWGSEVGAGIDDPDTMRAEEVWPEDAKVPVTERPYTIDELFVLASTGPPKFSLLRDFGLAELAKRGAAVGFELTPYFTSRIPREQHGLKDVFLRLGGAAVPFLASVLDTGSVAAAREAAFCLGEMGQPSAIGPLSRALDREAGVVRAECAQAIGKVLRRSAGDTTAVAQLLPRLRALCADTSASVRRSATFALGALRAPSVAEALVTALDDAFVGVRMTALGGLMDMRESALPLLARRVVHPGIGREWALLALERSRVPEAARVLERIEGVASWRARERIAFAKAAAGHPESQRLRRVLRGLAEDEDWRVMAIARDASARYPEPHE